jgi:serine/threonine protein kinase
MVSVDLGKIEGKLTYKNGSIISINSNEDLTKCWPKLIPHVMEIIDKSTVHTDKIICPIVEQKLTIGQKLNIATQLSNMVIDLNKKGCSLIDLTIYQVFVDNEYNLHFMPLGIRNNDKIYTFGQTKILDKILPFVAPELRTIENINNVTPESDVYALGRIIYYMMNN